MKFPRKRLAGLSLAIFFTVASIYCCCAQDVEAKNVPACHQTQDQEPHHQKEHDCCHKLPAIIKEEVSLPAGFSTVLALTPILELPNPTISDSNRLVLYQAVDTSPLYLKHSVLRL